MNNTFLYATLGFIFLLSFIPGVGVAQTSISSLTAATGSNTINNGNNQQKWEWNSLTSGAGLYLYTDASNANSGQSLLYAYSNGTSDTGTQTGDFINENTGTGSTNYAILATADSGSQNYGVWGQTLGEVAGDAGVVGYSAGTSSSIVAYGVYGLTYSSASYAGYFNNAGGGPAGVFVGGNVGIGTATPVNLLDIGTSGGIHIGSGVPSSTSMALYNNGGTLTWNGTPISGGGGSGTVSTGSAGQVAYYQSTGTTVIGTSALNIVSGNIGIGTNLPTNLLSLAGSAAQTIWMERNPTSNTAGNSLAIQASGATTGATNKNGGSLTLASGISTGTGSSSIQFQTYNSGSSGTSDNSSATVMAITGTGDIGIGTTTPTNLLSLSGAANRTVWMERVGSGAGNNLTIQAGGGQTTGTNENGGTLILGSGISTGTGSSSIQFQTYNAGSSGTSDNSAVTAMTIAGAGNVGIGTQTIANLLDVNGNASIGYKDVAAPTNGLAVSGGVGLGTATPGAPLDVYDSATNDIIHVRSGNYYMYLGAQNGYTSLGSYELNVAAAPLALQPVGGNVGIGTTNPGQLLDVVGSAAQIRILTTTADAALSLYNVGSGGRTYWLDSGSSGAGVGTGNFAIYDQTAGLSRLTINSSGDVGISNTTPSYLLHVGSPGASGAVLGLQNSAGTCTHNPSSSSETVSCSSDARLKANIHDASSALAVLKDIQVRDFTIKATHEHAIGVVAQEMLSNHPNMVHEDRYGYYTVDEPNPWLLVKAIQELKISNDDLRKKLEADDTTIAALKSQLKM